MGQGRRIFHCVLVGCCALGNVASTHDSGGPLNQVLLYHLALGRALVALGAADGSDTELFIVEGAEELNGGFGAGEGGVPDTMKSTPLLNR